MIQFSIETHIERPVGEVFAYATDPDRLATWQTNAVSAVREDDGPLGLGSRLREATARQAASSSSPSSRSASTSPTARPRHVSSRGPPCTPG